MAARDRNIESLQAANRRLRAENQRLQGIIDQLPCQARKEARTETTADTLSAQEKITLFRQLFRGREDIYARQRLRKDGKPWYAPACRHRSERGWCPKKPSKCGSCEQQAFIPVSDNIVHEHLTGRQTIGVYPLLPDDRCWFLAIDLDKDTWQDDARILRMLCSDWGLSPAIERSRSGSGAHIWFFFKTPLSAALARRFGCLVLARAAEQSGRAELPSFDRLFPSQDMLPQGGFGNLIALPLQQYPRQQGNSVFVDEKLTPYPDQWMFLAQLSRVSREQLQHLLQAYTKENELFKDAFQEQWAENPWTPAEKEDDQPVSLPAAVNVTLSEGTAIAKDALPAAVLNRLLRLASFPNPDFYRSQAMRLPIYDKPMVIHCGDGRGPEHIWLPRGCLQQVKEFFDRHGVQLRVEDRRTSGCPVDLSFCGELRQGQQQAVAAILAEDIGILHAATGFGKTAAAAAVIASRSVNTLIVVHTTQLLAQWRRELASFLDRPLDAIGQWGGGKKQPRGAVDVAMLQSLVRKGHTDPLVKDYGQIIVDECHHVSAFGFEQVLKTSPARYILGLTATLQRRDGHHPIVLMQCGPVRYRYSAKEQASREDLEQRVTFHPSSFPVPAHMAEPTIQELYQLLADDAQRNEQILALVTSALAKGRTPLVLTQRVRHAETLQQQAWAKGLDPVVLHGRLGKHQLREQEERLPDGEKTNQIWILATGQYIGEGFDCPQLDTLILAQPTAGGPRLEQYIGRIQRQLPGKEVVEVHDFLDHSPMLASMQKKRRRLYRKLGFELYTAGEEPQGRQLTLDALLGSSS